MPIRVSVIVECEVVTNSHDVIARVAFSRADPDRRESAIGIGLNERVRQDVARSAREEHFLRQGPVLNRVSFSAFCAQWIHFRMLRANSMNYPSPSPSLAPMPSASVSTA